MFPVLKKLINEIFQCMLQYIIKQKNNKKINDCLGCNTTLSLKRSLLTMVLLSLVDLLNHSQIQVFWHHKVLESIILLFPHFSDPPSALAIFVLLECIVQKFNHFVTPNSYALLSFKIFWR